MNWFLNLGRRGKLFLGFALMILFLAAVIVTAYTGITTIQESQQRLYNEDFANAVDLMALRMNQNGVRAAQLTMMSVTRRSDQEVWHQDLRDRVKEIDEVMPRLFERGRNEPMLLRRLEELRTTREAYKQTRDTEVIPLIYAGKVEEAKKLVLGIQGERYLKMRSIEQELGKEA